MGATLLLVTCIGAGLVAVWVMRAALMASSSAPAVSLPGPVTSAMPQVAAPTSIERPRSATMARIPAPAARTSTEFPVEPTVCAESLFEFVRTDVIAVPPPPRMTPSISVIDPIIEREQTLRAATAAIDALCDEGWESTREIKRRSAPMARGSGRMPVQALAPLRVIENVRAPAARKRKAKLMGTVLAARSLMSRCFDAVSTVEAIAHTQFDESTAVDELTNNEMPPWLAPTSARFAP